MRALNKGEAECISAGDEGAGLWVVVWSKEDECVDEGDNTRVMWTEAHTTLEEEEDNMSPWNRRVAWANEQVDEVAKIGAINDGAEVAERIAKSALDTRKKVYAAI